MNSESRPLMVPLTVNVSFGVSFDSSLQEKRIHEKKKEMIRKVKLRFMIEVLNAYQVNDNTKRKQDY